MVFTSFWYRLLMFLIIPAALIVVNGGMSFLMGGAADILSAALIVMVETVSDYWLFGGICAKDAQKLEYMKSSVKGIPVMRSGLIADLVRRFVWIAVLQGIGMVISHSMNHIPFDEIEICRLAAYVAGAYFWIVVTLNISRYIESFHILYLIIMVAMVAAVWYEVAMMILCDIFPAATVLGTVVLAAAASVITVWHMIKRVKRSYYDEKY